MHEFLLLLMVISDNIKDNNELINNKFLKMILSICSLQVYLEQVESIIEFL